MPKSADLMGEGLPAALAGDLGFSPTNITAAGSTAGAGTTLPDDLHYFLVTAATTTAVAVTFSTACAIGTPIFVANLNASRATASVFAPSTGTMNGGTSAVTLITGQTGWFIQSTAGVWQGGKLS